MYNLKEEIMLNIPNSLINKKYGTNKRYDNDRDNDALIIIFHITSGVNLTNTQMTFERLTNKIGEYWKKNELSSNSFGG